MDTNELIERLALQPHPEGGMYAETWRADAPPGTRPTGTAIYFLLRAGERSHWHRVDATEIWHHYAGDPIQLQTSTDGIAVRTEVLGPDLARGEAPQRIVAPHVWQAACSLGAWTLVGCTVSPGFDFSGFELAPRAWAPSEA
jgi:predicted cupin superfamily sugar epimerase